MGVRQRKPSDPIGKAEAAIKFARGIKVLGMNRKVVARPQADIGL